MLGNLHLASYKRLAALRLPRERDGETWIGSLGQQMQTIIHRMVKQQTSICEAEGIVFNIL